MPFVVVGGGLRKGLNYIILAGLELTMWNRPLPLFWVLGLRGYTTTSGLCNAFESCYGRCEDAKEQVHE